MERFYLYPRLKMLQKKVGGYTLIELDLDYRWISRIGFLQFLSKMARNEGRRFSTRQKSGVLVSY